MSNRLDVHIPDGSYAPLFTTLAVLLFSNKDLAPLVFQIIKSELTREYLYEYYRCYYERLLEPGDKTFEKLMADIAKSTSLSTWLAGRSHLHHHGLLLLAFANALRVNLVVFSAASVPNNNNNNNGPVVFHFEGSPFPNACFCLGHVHGGNYVIIREKRLTNQVIVNLDDDRSNPTPTASSSQNNNNNNKKRCIKAENQEASNNKPTTPTPTKRVKNEHNRGGGGGGGSSEQPIDLTDD